MAVTRFTSAGTYVVPAGVRVLQYRMQGSPGGGPAAGIADYAPGTPAFVSGFLAVTPGESLTIQCYPRPTGRFPTGGGGGTGGQGSNGIGFAGGGYSRILRGSTILSCAGGGGGAAQYAYSTDGYVGAGGGISGGTGHHDNPRASNGGGQYGGGGGGGFSAGQAGDRNGVAFGATAGGSFQGGNGGGSGYWWGGGGGGGGYYGGGGGAASAIDNSPPGGGGGGSSFYGTQNLWNDLGNEFFAQAFIGTTSTEPGGPLLLSGGYVDLEPVGGQTNTILYARDTDASPSDPDWKNLELTASGVQNDDARVSFSGALGPTSIIFVPGATSTTQGKTGLATASFKGWRENLPAGATYPGQVGWRIRFAMYADAPIIDPPLVQVTAALYVVNGFNHVRRIGLQTGRVDLTNGAVYSPEFFF